MLDGSNNFIKISTYIDPDFNDRVSLGKGKDKKISFNRINFIDSFRIFPIGLDKLCAMFDVTGKSQAYDSRFNNFKLFSKGNIKDLKKNN